MTADLAQPRRRGRVRAALGTALAAVLGMAPHVLHHAGPLAGAALLAGATGTVLFGVLGFVLSIPMLRAIRRRTGSWRVPGAMLAVMATVFTLSSLVVGPALTGDEDERPAGVTPAEHDAHHP